MSQATTRCDVSTHDVLALAGKLQEAAEALLVFCRSGPVARQHDAGLAAETPKEKPLGEYRRYRLPPHTLREERDFLEQFGAQSVSAALYEVYNGLHVVAYLMQRWDCEENCCGFEFALVGEHLERLLKPLSRACSLLADFTSE